MKPSKRKTEIIATLGPSSSSEAMIKKLITNGMNCARLNFSHGTDSEHLKQIKRVRSLAKKAGRKVGLLQDLAGYRVRIGSLGREIPLRKGDEFYLTQEEIAGNAREVPFDYDGSLRGIKKGNRIYIEDGKILVQVVSSGRIRLKVKTLVPGVLKPRKGINIPEAKLEFEALTEKDRRDVQMAIRHKLDYVAQSFVRDGADICRLKEIVKPAHPRCRVIAKIENPDSLRNIDEIIDEADGIMVARGDMGICVPIYKVPVIQKIIISKCRKARKPVIVATQMLDSMTENLIPTRAEVSDVANAIWDGATHCMLSGETAVGKHPHRVVKMMRDIICHTEEAQGKLDSLLED